MDQKSSPQIKAFPFPSELRYDLISNDWVVIATGRARRPETFKKEKRKKDDLSKDNCPFCKLEDQEKPVLVFSKNQKIDCEKEISDNWTTFVIPNKFPAFIPASKIETKQESEFYQTMNAVGFHEVVVTRDHEKSLGQFSLCEIEELLQVYQERYLDLMTKDFVNYINVFHNHGKEAGASISHPHSQIITTPLIDVDLKRALENSQIFYKKKKKCIYCEMTEWELKVQKRIVFENEEFAVVCPFASKLAFQMIITPKKHLPYFEKIKESERKKLAEAFQVAFGKLYRGLDDPSYNFYLHTAPCDRKEHPYYHWHWTILPKTSTWAGFELGARMEISTIEPEKAAEYLRQQ